MADHIEVEITWDQSGIRKRVVYGSDELDLSDCLAEAILMLRPARLCAVLADIVLNCLEGTGESEEFFPGYNAALDLLCGAATTIRKGWVEHDRKCSG